MKRVLRFLSTVVLLGALGYGAYVGVQYVRKQREVPAEDAAARVLRVSAVAVRLGDVEQAVTLTGEIEATSCVELTPKITGRLQRLALDNGAPVDEGTVVKEGQVVAVLEHEDLAAQVAQAEAALKVARAAVEVAKVNVKDRRREKARMENLFKDGSGTEKQRDLAVTDYERAAATRAQAEAGVAQAQAAIHQAKVNLREATIEAPMGGIVSKKYVDEGNMVGPTTPLVRIVQIDAVEITGGVSERHVAALVSGKTAARITVDAYPGEKFDGVLSKVFPEVDPQTRTVEVQIRTPNPGHRLKPGMFARLRLRLRRRENVPIVPDAALLRQGEEVFAYVVNRSKAHRRVLRLGLSEGERHEVLEGLRPGDLVVIRGQHMLQDGDNVELVEGDER